MADLPDDITDPAAGADRIRDRIRDHLQDDGGDDLGAKWSKLESKADGGEIDPAVVRERIESKLDNPTSNLEIEQTATFQAPVDDITQGTTVGSDALRIADDVADKVVQRPGDSYTSSDGTSKTGIPERVGYTAASDAHKGGTPVMADDSVLADPVGDLLPPLEDTPDGDAYETVTLSIDDDGLGDDLEGA